MYIQYSTVHSTTVLYVQYRHAYCTVPSCTVCTLCVYTLYVVQYDISCTPVLTVQYSNDSTTAPGCLYTVLLERTDTPYYDIIVAKHSFEKQLAKSAMKQAGKVVVN